MHRTLLALALVLCIIASSAECLTLHGDGNVRASISDPRGHFGYFATEVGNIVQIRLSDMTRAGNVTLRPGEEWFPRVLLADEKFLYLGADSSPASRVVRIKIPQTEVTNVANFVRFDDVTFPLGYEDLRTGALFTVAANDSVAAFNSRTTYAVFGGAWSRAGVLVKVMIEDLSMTIVATTAALADAVMSIVIVKPTALAHESVFAFCGLRNGFVTKVRLTALTGNLKGVPAGREGALELIGVNLNLSPNIVGGYALTSAFIDVGGELVFFTQLNSAGPGSWIVQVRAPWGRDMEIVSTTALAPGETQAVACASSQAAQLREDYAMIATSNGALTPSAVVKVAGLASGQASSFHRVGALAVDPAPNIFTCFTVNNKSFVTAFTAPTVVFTVLTAGVVADGRSPGTVAPGNPGAVPPLTTAGGLTGGAALAIAFGVLGALTIAALAIVPRVLGKGWFFGMFDTASSALVDNELVVSGIGSTAAAPPGAENYSPRMTMAVNTM